MARIPMSFKELREGRSARIPEFILSKMLQGFELSDIDKAVVRSRGKVYVESYKKDGKWVKPQLRDLPSGKLNVEILTPLEHKYGMSGNQVEMALRLVGVDPSRMSRIYMFSRWEKELSKLSSKDISALNKQLGTNIKVKKYKFVKRERLTPDDMEHYTEVAENWVLSGEIVGAKDVANALMGWEMPIDDAIIIAEYVMKKNPTANYSIERMGEMGIDEDEAKELELSRKVDRDRMVGDWGEDDPDKKY